MKTTTILKEYNYIAPDGAEVRLLSNNEHGGICHCTLKNKKTSHAVQHKTVSEFWHIISGKGEIWRKNGAEESITPLEAGITIDIPVNTTFQYRSLDGDLTFICVTMPPWSGANESFYIEKSPWIATV
ncbi:MAG: cupin [Coxiellaceae bacterium]|nr:cupin [Coxiellaceae bacterium]